MAASIRSIATVVPETVLAQGETRDMFARQPGRSGLGVRRITSVFDAAAIDTRHTVIAELAGGGAGATGLFLEPGTGVLRSPPTGTRNDVYRREAGRLFVTAARAAVEAAPGVDATDVSDPDAVVLVVAVELCTLHLHAADDTDTILSSSLFADRGAAAVVTARPAPPGTPLLDLDAFSSTLMSRVRTTWPGRSATPASTWC